MNELLAEINLTCYQLPGGFTGQFLEMKASFLKQIIY